MVVVYILSPILMMLLGFMFGAPLIWPVEEKPVHTFSLEERTLLILRSQFIEGKLDVEQYEEAVDRALHGAGFMQSIEGMDLPYTRRPLMAADPRELADGHV